MKKNARFFGLAVALAAGFAFAADSSNAKKPAAKSSSHSKPTMADVHYGPATNQVLDFYKADATEPTPLVFFIHGGGWVHGDNHVAHWEDYVAAGISVVSIQYRFTDEAKAAGAKPPVEWPLHDAARALQFVRSKAAEWNIDKKRIGASGGSAGACSSLWLAFHDDMANPKSDDPIARESTRLMCAAVTGAQTSLDPKQMREWTPNIGYGGHAFGFEADSAKHISQFQAFFDGREKVLPWIKEYSPYELVTSDDPPIYLTYSTPPAMGQTQTNATHSANFGVGLQEKLRVVNVPCELVFPGAPDVKHKTMEEFLIAMLKQPAK